MPKYISRSLTLWPRFELRNVDAARKAQRGLVEVLRPHLSLNGIEFGFQSKSHFKSKKESKSQKESKSHRDPNGFQISPSRSQRSPNLTPTRAWPA